MARTDADGNFVLTGRADDMFKVNGNRVEPSEIEAIVRELTGLECAVKGFEKDGMSVALYYVSDRELDSDRLTEQMKHMLPEYMIPSHFVRLDNLPRTAIGKLDRKNLPAPEAVFEEYAAPRTELEKRFCKAIADELGVERVGLQDDFFLMGGTSLNVLNLISRLELNGFEAEHFYKARKIGNIIGRYLDSRKTVSLTEKEKEMKGRRTLQVLEGINNNLPNDLAIDQLAGGGIVWNMPQILSLPLFADMERLCRATNDYIASSSTFQTGVARNADGKLCYRHCPELVKEIRVERMSATDAKEAIRTFVRPFPLLEGLPYRIRLICAGLHNYLLFDIHHIFTDGEGLVHIGDDIFKLYRGQKPGSNNFFAWIADERTTLTDEQLQENLCALKKHFDGTKWGGMFGNGTGENRHIKYTVDSGIRLKDFNRCLAERGWTRDSLLYAAFALSAAKCTQSKDILFEILYGRRAGIDNHAGVRFCALNLGLHLSGIKTADGLVAAVEMDRIRAMAYTSPNYSEAFGGGNPWVLDDLGDIASGKNGFRRWVKTIEPFLDPKYENGTSPTGTKAIRFSNSRGHLVLSPDYNTFFAGEEDVKRLCSYTIDALKRLISGDGRVVRDYLR